MLISYLEQKLEPWYTLQKGKEAGLKLDWKMSLLQVEGRFLNIFLKKINYIFNSKQFDFFQ